MEFTAELNRAVDLYVVETSLTSEHGTSCISDWDVSRIRYFDGIFDANRIHHRTFDRRNSAEYKQRNLAVCYVLRQHFELGRELSDQHGLELVEITVLTSQLHTVWLNDSASLNMMKLMSVTLARSNPTRID